MSDRKKRFANIPGAKPMDPKLKEELFRVMREKAVPKVVRAVQDRQLLASESRFRTTKRPPKS